MFGSVVYSFGRLGGLGVLVCLEGACVYIYTSIFIYLLIYTYIYKYIHLVIYTYIYIIFIVLLIEAVVIIAISTDAARVVVIASMFCRPCQHGYHQQQLNMFNPNVKP